MFLALWISLNTAFSFELISHKGVHHDECLNDMKICRSDCLNWAPHTFFENTIPAIRKAFELGASRVEIDLRFTKDQEIILYHDAELECKTQDHGPVGERSLKELRRLDVGYNLLFIQKEGYLMRGKGQGLITTLREVLTTFPHKKFFLNPKESDPRFLKKLNDEIHTAVYINKTHQIDDFSMWGPWVNWESLKKKFPDLKERFSNAYAGTSCENTYQMLAWTGYFPEHCKNLLMVYSHERINTWNTWGWPTQLLENFHKNGSKVYMIHVNDKEDLIRYRAMGFDGVISSRLMELQ